MTKEQAIEKLKKLDYLLDDVYSTGLVEDEERNKYQDAIETVLPMIEEKDKEIQFQNDINKTELDRHNKTEKNLKGIIKKQNKIIDLMAEYIFCNQDDKFLLGYSIKDTKQYFENKAKELLNK